MYDSPATTTSPARRRAWLRVFLTGLVLWALTVAVTMATGNGFAAFESAGYAFTALFTEHGLSLTQLVQTELLRGLLAPVGHGLWTAILGGVLFSASGRRQFSFTDGW